MLLVEQRTLGAGASSRAAGMVRAQGGTEPAVRLGQWTQRFYRGQADEYAIDSGFVETGYYMPCFTPAEVDGRARADRDAERARPGQPVWVGPDDVDRRNPILAPGRTLGCVVLRR